MIYKRLGRAAAADILYTVHTCWFKCVVPLLFREFSFHTKTGVLFLSFQFVCSGSNNGDAVGQQSTPTQQPPVLQFHTSTRGDNVRISPDHATAHRVDSFCKGIAFSQRSVRPNEKVYLRVAETSTSWNGVLRIGFTSNNPSLLNGVLPKYACPGNNPHPF